MFYSLALAFLLAASLLPPVYIRYIPFRTVVAPAVKRRLFGSYAGIFMCEYIGISIAFSTSVIASTWMFCKFFLMTA